MIQDIKHQIQKINPDLLSWADEYIAQLPDISQNTIDVEEPELSVFDLLEQLGQLRENGILTDDEFTEQKKRLLEKL